MFGVLCMCGCPGPQVRMVCNAWRVVCVCVAAQGPRSGWCVMFGVLCVCVWLSRAPGKDSV